MFSHAGIIRLLRTPRNKCRPTTSVIDFLGSEYSIACATLSNPHSNSASSSSSSEYNKALSLKSCGGLYGGSLLSLSSSWRNDPFGPTIRIDCELRELILNWSSSSSVLKAVSTFDNRTRSVAGSWLVWSSGWSGSEGSLSCSPGMLRTLGGARGGSSIDSHRTKGRHPLLLLCWLLLGGVILTGQGKVSAIWSCRYGWQRPLFLALFFFVTPSFIGVPPAFFQESILLLLLGFGDPGLNALVFAMDKKRKGGVCACRLIAFTKERKVW